MDFYDGIDRGIITFCTRILFKVIFVHFEGFFVHNFDNEVHLRQEDVSV